MASLVMKMPVMDCSQFFNLLIRRAIAGLYYFYFYADDYSGAMSERSR
jgi:hypothetical protein